MQEILVLFYSAHGNVARMAHAVARGIDSVLARLPVFARYRAYAQSLTARPNQCQVKARPMRN